MDLHFGIFSSAMCVGGNNGLNIHRVGSVSCSKKGEYFVHVQELFMLVPRLQASLTSPLYSLIILQKKIIFAVSHPPVLLW